MSMNLRCAEVELRMTPSYITYLCYHGTIDQKGFGKSKASPWRTILAKYLLWFKHESLESCPPERLEDREQQVVEHEKKIARAIQKYGRLHFSIE